MSERNLNFMIVHDDVVTCKRILQYLSIGAVEFWWFLFRKSAQAVVQTFELVILDHDVHITSPWC